MYRIKRELCMKLYAVELKYTVTCKKSADCIERYKSSHYQF